MTERLCVHCQERVPKLNYTDHAFYCEREKREIAATLRDRAKRFPHLKPKTIEELRARKAPTDR